MKLISDRPMANLMLYASCVGGLLAAVLVPLTGDWPWSIPLLLAVLFHLMYRFTFMGDPRLWKAREEMRYRMFEESPEEAKRRRAMERADREGAAGGQTPP